MTHASASERGMRVVAAVLLALALLPAVVIGGALWWLQAAMPAGAAGPTAVAHWAYLAAVTALICSAMALGLWWWAVRRPVLQWRQAERRLRQQAWRDPLTGLLNRDGLALRLAHALASPRSGSPRLGLLLLDLDRFNLHNVTLGQAGGNLVLQAVAERLRGLVRDGDTLARLGSDQFVVVTSEVGSPEVLEAAACNLLRAFESPLALGPRQVQPTLSIGGVLAEHGACADTLLRRAGAALRAAKTAGGARCSLFQAAMDDDAEGLLELELRLRHALAHGQFFLLYQPIVDARCGRVVAVEALLRWACPARGVVSPAEFVPVLESTGLIMPVGHWVLQEACRQAARWRDAAEPAPVLSVNISPRQFAEPDFEERVHAALRGAALPAERLQLEVTEGLLLEPAPATLRRIGALVRLGVRLAVDDFGMGYSSLAYLKRYPLQAMKIDRMFVCDIAEQPRDRAIVRAMIDLGHALGLSVTAEGVETEAQRVALADMACDHLQGYLFSRPVAAEALAAALAEAPGAALAEAPGAALAEAPGAARADEACSIAL